ncbi:MAG: hypothetical protein ACXWCV_09675 [Caldimonas sp.]
MFLKNSRYAGLPTVAARGPRSDGSIVVVKLRPLPDTPGDPTAIRAHDQLDAMSETLYAGDATRYWHIADANSELEAAELTRTTGRVVDVPKS